MSELKKVTITCHHEVIRELVSGLGHWVCNQCRSDVTLILENLPNARRIAAVVEIKAVP